MAAAIASIGIGDDRNIHHAGHIPRMGCHFGLCEKTKIGRAEAACRRAEPGHVNGRKPCLLHETSGQRIGCARRLNDVTGFDEAFQGLCLRHHCLLIARPKRQAQHR